MGFWQRIKLGRARRRFLRTADGDAAAKLANAPLNAAAPEIAHAISELHRVVTISAYDATAAAHDSLTPVCEALIENMRRDFERRHTRQAETIRELASRCRDEVERSNNQLIEHGEHLRVMREQHAVAQERTQRFEDGYDWQIIREFAFRLITVLDQLEHRITACRNDLQADACHLADLEATYESILQILRASGVQPIRPQPNTSFVGKEKVAAACAEVPTDCLDHHGKIAAVKRPGYVLSRVDRDDIVLRRADVVVFAATNFEQSRELQGL